MSDVVESTGLSESVVLPARYRVLGLVELTGPDGTVRLASRQQRTLLAMLLVEANRPVEVSRLAEELWGERLPSDPRVALRTQVSRLRKRLGDDALVTEDNAYRLRVESGQLDAAQFEDFVKRADAAPTEDAVSLLDRGLALWHGRAFAEFADRTFAQPEAVRLDELRAMARAWRGELLIAIGRADEAIADLEALLVENPEREGARAVLMRALYRSGRHTEALRVYQAWRRHLGEELGLDPSPELKLLEQQILQHEVAGSGRREWHAVPRPVTMFFGRASDVTEVDDALEQRRLVVLCGPGGVGKTRLAVEVAARVSRRYPHGVAFCDLSSVARGADVARVVSAAVAMEERGTRDLTDQLVGHLRKRRCLLVMDNCEHVIDAAARLAARLIESTPQADVLATSREPLAVPGEFVVNVAPLPTEGTDTAAASLFIDRARAARPGFNGSVGQLETVNAICRQLDGLPLAIELAAARVRNLTLPDLVRGLEDRFQLLVGRRHDGERHRSLRAVLDWSYDMLTASEQMVFDELAVFSSWFDLDDARSVVAADAASDAAAAILRLVDCSLVVTRHDGDVTGYALLDSMRSYGVDQLRSRQGLDAARDRHAAWALTLAEDMARGLAGPDEGLCAARVSRHFAEFRAAHEWLVGRDPHRALRLIAALRPYAMWRRNTEVGLWAEVSASVASGTGDELLPAVLLCAFVGAWQRGDYEAAQELARSAEQAVRPADPADVPYVVDALADVAFFAGDVDAAARLHRQAAERAIAAGDLLQAMWTLGSVSHALMYGGRLAEARAAAAETMALAEQCGSPTARAMQEWVLGELEASTDLETAQAHLEQAIDLAASAGSRQIVLEAEYGLAIVKSRRGDVTGALSHFEALLTDTSETKTGILPRDLVRIIEVLARAGSLTDAALLCGSATSSRRSARRFPVAEATLMDVLAQLRSALGVAEMHRLTEEGAALDEEEIVTASLEAVRRVTRK
ncbi:MAG: AAA family ATPase [Frankia sp.]|nr:AAA family ATPase [Frankia sp.]